MLAHLPPMQDDLSRKTGAFPPSPSDMVPVAGAAPHNFCHVNSWIFDLDNTLYDAGSRFLAGVEERIALFVETRLNMEPEPARALQKDYYHAHGTTLAGLMRHHVVDPEDYLAFVNDVDVGALTPNPALRENLKRLPGRRFVFTNNCGRYADRVLERLGIDDLFEAVWDVRVTRFIPKPVPEAYDLVTKLAGISTPHAAMFDDIPHNLLPSHALGMTTVWLNSRPGTVARPVHIHYETADLCSFLKDLEVSSPQ